MKTAEEWSKEVGTCHCGGDVWNKVSPQQVSAIQADALRHAGEIMKHSGQAVAHGIGRIFLLVDELDKG